MLASSFDMCAVKRVDRDYLADTYTGVSLFCPQRCLCFYHFAHLGILFLGSAIEVTQAILLFSLSGFQLVILGAVKQSLV